MTKLCCLYDTEETCDCERAAKAIEKASKSRQWTMFNNQRKMKCYFCGEETSNEDQVCDTWTCNKQFIEVKFDVVVE